MASPTRAQVNLRYIAGLDPTTRATPTVVVAEAGTDSVTVSVLVPVAHAEVQCRPPRRVHVGHDVAV
jgi:hypothetical protein